MRTTQIEILKPKTASIIQDLADSVLISLHQPVETVFSTILAKLKSSAESAPSLKEITKEAELVRAARNEQKKMYTCSLPEQVDCL